VGSLCDFSETAALGMATVHFPRSYPSRGVVSGHFLAYMQHQELKVETPHEVHQLHISLCEQLVHMAAVRKTAALISSKRRGAKPLWATHPSLGMAGSLFRRYLLGILKAPKLSCASLKLHATCPKSLYE